jgi:4'-phosphopantetheinyl transferase EntD
MRTPHSGTRRVPPRRGHGTPPLASSGVSTSLVTAVLPDGAAGAESWTDDRDITLFPAEEDYIADATPSRRREFTTVRWCARQALTALGAPHEPLVPAVKGAEFLSRYPAWPQGFTGSLTHCHGYRAAAVAGTGEIRALGIDAEPHDSLPAPALGKITSSGERELLDALRSRNPDIAWDRIVFSAKESVFKAWFPLTRRWFDLPDCTISINPAHAAFTADLPPEVVAAVPATRFTVIGRWAVSGALRQGHIVTSAVIR